MRDSFEGELNYFVTIPAVFGLEFATQAALFLCPFV